MSDIHLLRIGHGYDVHRLVEGRDLILGGVKIPHVTGLLGHSDADVLLHALMDSMLGAIGEGDIGRHFPDTDERYRGISSMLLLERVQELCPLCVEVVSGEKEASLGVSGALGDKDGGLIDVGGASTEIVVRKQKQVLYQKSVNIGVVRLKDKCGRDKTALEREGKWAVQEFGKVLSDAPVYAIGGTATTLAAQVLGLETYSSEKITGAVITAEELQAMADKLLAMSVEEIAALPCMPKGRADVLTGGAVLFTVLMKNLGFTRIIASDRDNLEGYAIKKGLME